MELFSMEFLSALLSIIIIDLVLAGDNAIVIGLAARNLPKHQQKKAVIWGTVGAVVIRALATLFVVWLLKVPGLLLVGGILLVWIAYKLLVEEKGHDVEAVGSLWEAIRTIVIADALMGLDNVLAVAGAAHGSFLLVILGLLISVPIMVWGSTLILKWIDRFPIIITIGAGVLAWTASKMIVDEPFLDQYFANPIVKYGFEILVIAGVIAAGTLKKKKGENQLETKAANE
ncbi:TerC family protein [Parageobacillus toebii NBRC 107807]|uniref:YjbE family integral membrane protein n=1 Tax=Parageobacillus toebii NBRC 107807 TaxID=1223503 RepID=A0A6G9J3A2_9BACL|nr:TerC family protein [Parageobacillus toebii]MBB3868411.1 YjbE family integral membrane protein [Parageobacillus toebii NBRC 107807]QIQ32659.1 TerC family protein [Parageobacillus toebii NBRC 107807]WMT20553.1 TerC family protein [Parageobacillus toebii]